MPRRCCPWTAARPTMAVAAAAALTIICKGSVAFVQLKCRPHLSTPESLRPRSWQQGRHQTTWRGVPDVCRRRSREALRLCLTETQIALEDSLSGAGPTRPEPFVSRKLGSFEKMLTQTRDGVGPAEEGVRTLLTPHVWVSDTVDARVPLQQ